MVSRFKPAFVELGIFLVDAFCLGIKDATYAQVDHHEYESVVQTRIFRDKPPVKMEAVCGRKLVEGALGYAARFGFAPHADYKKAARVLGGIDAAGCPQQFTFGKDGKPLFVADPHDTPERVRAILAALKHHCGEGNYHYILPGQGFGAPSGRRRSTTPEGATASRR